ncbi:MAG: GntR family transcriptional regulator [Desulfatiglandales bacterium]|jgi:DNA-binding GntR family transcriptional regulator
MGKLLDRPNLRDQVYDILKRMIVLKEIKPGEKINEEELADKVGVSRTPIRETLCRLENEGIVRIIPRRGAFVVTLSREEIVEILQIREVLEGLVAQLASQNMDKRTLSRLKVCLEKINSSPDGDNKLLKYTPADMDFHSLLLEASKNKMLQNMMGIVNSHLQMIRLRTVVLPGRAQKTVEEHFKVLDAIEKGDIKAAERLMRKHIQSVRNDAVKNIDLME